MATTLSEAQRSADTQMLVPGSPSAVLNSDWSYKFGKIDNTHRTMKKDRGKYGGINLLWQNVYSISFVLVSDFPNTHSL